MAEPLKIAGETVTGVSDPLVMFIIITVMFISFGLVAFLIWIYNWIR